MIRENIVKIKKSSRAERIRSIFIFIIISGLFFSAVSTHAQTTPDSPTPPKQEEIFKPAYGLVTSSPSATKRTIYDISENETMKIYNADGSMWYEFSFYEKSPLYYKKNSKSDFKPFAPQAYGHLYLRLQAISSKRYEVVVNEETQETKYMLIKDPILGRESIEQIILRGGRVTFDKESNPLRESPDGQIKQNIEVTDEIRFIPNQIDGDWLEVRIPRSAERGWIRWRKDNDILICCIFDFSKKY
jgi:hypothetical protein